MKNIHTEATKEFFKALLLLESEEDCRDFFEDICTVKELQDISQRLEVARMLDDGKSYQVVSKETGASTATISRVKRCLVYGSGGYKKILEKLEENK